MRGGTAVVDDLHVPVRGQYINEYPVAILGVPHVQVREGLQRALARREAAPYFGHLMRVLDAEAELAAAAWLGRGDRVFYGPQDGVREMAARSGARGEQVTE